MKRIVLVLAVVMLSTLAFATVPDNPYSVTFTCTGSQGPFPFTFPISDPTAMTVTLNGSLLPSSSYTITAVNNNYNNGGNVTLGGVALCTTGLVLVLERVTPITQALQFYDNMPALPTTTGRGLDKATEIMQEIWGGTIHSLQAINNGTPYGPAMQGEDISINMLPPCTWTGTVPNLNISCPTGGGGGGSTPEGPVSSVQTNLNGTTFNGYSWFVVNVGLESVIANAFSTSTLPVYNLLAHGLVGDAVQVGTADPSQACLAMTSGSPTVNINPTKCPWVSFVSSDVGKSFFVFGAGNAGGNNYLNSTILSWQSSTQVTLANNATSNQVATFGFYGTDNTAAWCTAMQCSNPASPNQNWNNINTGRIVKLPRGTYLTTGPIYTRRGDILEGDDETVSAIIDMSNTNNDSALLACSSTSGVDAGGATCSVKGIWWATPENSTVTCINDNGADMNFISRNWFQCGIGMKLSNGGTIVSDNTFDNSGINGIIMTGTGGCTDSNPAGVNRITHNLFFAQSFGAIQFNGVNSTDVVDNTFVANKFFDISFTSGNNCKVNISNNQFQTSGNSSFYDASNVHVTLASGATITSSQISNNTFAAARQNDIVLGSGTVHGLAIDANTFSGSQASSVTDVSGTATGLRITNNSFYSPGQFATDFTVPVYVANNYCTNPFAVTAAPTGYNGCFVFAGAFGIGTAYNNTTDSTSYAAVAEGGASGTTYLNTAGNRSQWSTADVTINDGQTGHTSSWNERITNLAGAGNTAFSSYLNPTTGDVYLTGAMYLNGGAGTAGQCPISAGAGSPVAWGSCGSGSPGGSVGQVQWNNTTFGGITNFLTDGTNPIMVVLGSTPSLPASGRMTMYASAGVGICAVDSTGATFCPGGGGGGSTNPAPQYQLPFYSVAGTHNTLSGSATITTDANGSLYVGNTTTGPYCIISVVDGSITCYSVPGTLLPFNFDGAAISSTCGSSGKGGICINTSLLPHYKFNGVDLGALTTVFLSTVAGTNTITAVAGGITAYDSNALYSFIPANSNTGAVTLNIDSVGAANVLAHGGGALSTGELSAGHVAVLSYNGTQFEDTSGSPATAGYIWTYVAQTGNYSILPTDMSSSSAFGKIETDTSSSNQTFTLSGTYVSNTYVRVENTGTAVLSIAPSGGIFLNGSTSATISIKHNQGAEIHNDGATGFHLDLYQIAAQPCASAASPAVCAAASTGFVAIAAGSNPTLVVDTTMVTANSQILVTEDQSLSTALSVTCNTTVPTGPLIVTARTANTSFTVEAPGTFTTNPVCLSYSIIN